MVYRGGCMYRWHLLSLTRGVQFDPGLAIALLGHDQPLVSF